MIGKLALASVLSVLAFATPALAGTCDRSCLKGVGETYLNALAARDVKQLPLAAQVRFTENGSELKLGDGLWGTIDGLLPYRLFVIDTASGNVGIFQAVTEAGHRALLGVRLKAPDGKISEVETLVARNDQGAGFGDAPKFDVRPAFTTALAASQRASRAEIIATADAYFVGLGKATDKVVPFADDCIRRENGMQTTSNPNFGNDMAKKSCREQFATGFSAFITGQRDRRWIVDEETGVAMAILFFDHAGTVKQVKLADGTTMEVPYPFTRPYSFQLFEAFKIADGKIHQVEALLNTVPYGMKSGWTGQP